MHNILKSSRNLLDPMNRCMFLTKFMFLATLRPMAMLRKDLFSNITFSFYHLFLNTLLIRRVHLFLCFLFLFSYLSLLSLTLQSICLNYVKLSREKSKLNSRMRRRILLINTIIEETIEVRSVFNSIDICTTQITICSHYLLSNGYNCCIYEFINIFFPLTSI